MGLRLPERELGGCRVQRADMVDTIIRRETLVG